MSHTIHDKQLSDKLDALFDVGRDFAKALLTRWLARQAGDQAGAVETSRRSAAETSPDDAGELLTTSQLAKRLNYSTRTIQQFKIEGMPFIGEGRNTRFELNKVIEWLKQRPQSHHKNNRVSMVGNGKISQAPIRTRLQAKRNI